MKKILLLPILLCLAFSLSAQEKFTGIIEYNVHNPEKNDGPAPDKMIMTRTPEKILLKLVYTSMGMEQWLLVNTLNDTLYRINPVMKNYMKMPLHSEAEEPVKLIRTDSVKVIMGYKCNGYQIADANNTASYLWLAESLGGLTKDYPLSLNMMMFGGRYVMLGADIFEQQQEVAQMTAVSIKKQETVPDSLFDLSAYREMLPPPAETAVVDTTLVAPVDTIAVKKYRNAPPKKKTPVKKTPGNSKPAARKPKQ